MTEKKQIEDDELVEITGGAGFEEVGAGENRSDPRPSPGPTHLPETDNEPGGDQEMGGL